MVCQEFSVSQKTYFIADTHFNDSNILRFENRPFGNVDEMNTSLVNQWNNIVTEDDTVYMLGDIGDVKFLKHLNGKKYLIKGNHDTETNEFYRNAGFIEVYDHPIILDSFWILSHDILYVSDNTPYANLFGHVHNSPIIKDYSSHHFCVSAERIEYAPVSFGHIKNALLTSQKEVRK